MSTSRESDRSTRRRPETTPRSLHARIRSRSSSIIANVPRRGTAVRRGLPPKIPAPTLDDDALLDLIYNEVDLRQEDGESPEMDEYLRRFPQYAEDLRAEFDVHRALQDGQPLHPCPVHRLI